MVMTLDAVKAEVTGWYTPLLGTFPNPDGAYGAQCKDLISHYIDHVHSEPYVRGNGIAMAGNLINQEGWKSILASARWQIGDVVSTNWGGAYGHVYVVLEDYGTGKVKMVDLNGGPLPANSGPDEAVKVRVTSKTGVVAVARPPRYVGATATQTAPAPAPVPQTPTQILSGMKRTGDIGPLYNAAAVVAAAQATGVPLYIAAALVLNESGGQNLFGADWGGIYSTNPNPQTFGSTTYTYPERVPVTQARYDTFLSLLLHADGSHTGRTSNGVGPLQLTFYGFHRDARERGLNLADPADNIRYGLELLRDDFGLGTDYSQPSVEWAGTRYNKGPSYPEINDYGRRLWTRAEQYRVALGAAADPGTPAPEPEPTPEPEPQIVDFTPRPPMVDPGPVPVLAAAVAAPASLPAPPPGPIQVRELIAAPTARVWFRDTWWAPHEDGLDINHTMGVNGPDQFPDGDSMVAADGTITLVRPDRLMAHNFPMQRLDPPTYGEPVHVDFSMDGGDTWVRRFTGIADGSDWEITETTLTMRVVQETEPLQAGIHHMPANFRMPSPINGRRYMSIGLHPAYLSNLVARRAGYYCTPPAPASSILSAPLVGSVLPEVGRAVGSWTLDTKASTAGIPSDSPDYVETWWGLTVKDVFTMWEPRFPAGASGVLDRPLGVRCLVGPVTDDPTHLEFFWDRESIMIQVRPEGVVVETQDGWNPDGTRVVRYGRTRGLTDAQKRDGFELTVWIHPDGRLSTDVDGVVHQHTPFPSFPRNLTTEVMSDIRLTTRVGATPVGGLVVVMDKDTTVLGDWDRNAVIRDDPDHMWFGLPALVDEPGLDLLTRKAEALLSSVWIDEDGVLQEWSRRHMDARPSVRALTLSDLMGAPGQLSRDGVLSTVAAKWLQPALSQNRLASMVATNLWFGPTDELRPGEPWETTAEPDEGVDWIYPDYTFLKLSSSTLAQVNGGLQSILPATTFQTDSDGNVEEGVPSVTWFNGGVTRLNWRSYQVNVRYQPPEGVKALMRIEAPDFAGGLVRSLVGKGALLRGRGRQVWKESTSTPVKTGADLRHPIDHVHDGGWFIQSPATAARVVARKAAMLAKPIPAWGPVELGVPDLSLRLGDTITLDLGGAPKACRVCGIHLSMKGGALSMSIALRQLHP